MLVPTTKIVEQMLKQLLMDQMIKNGLLRVFITSTLLLIVQFVDPLMLLTDNLLMMISALLVIQTLQETSGV
jgi:hypothetical protein